jgi:hypothetical protein
MVWFKNDKVIMAHIQLTQNNTSHLTISYISQVSQHAKSRFTKSEKRELTSTSQEQNSHR